MLQQRLFPIFTGRTTMEMPVGAFRCGAIRPRLGECPSPCAMTPDSTPTVRQLLAFYLEAGVDCALSDEPVDRLSDHAIVPVASEAPLSQPVRTIPAAVPALRGDT